MPALLLHQPVTEPAAILALVTSKAPETQHLEFKAEFWRNNPPADGNPAKDKRDEAAKDLAAMANALGGDIIIGIRDRESRAAAFAADPHLPGEPRKELLEMLRARIAPAAVAETVLVEPRTVTDADGIDRRVLVVTVPPWPHGPVGYRPSNGFEGYCFPRREGTHTIPMGYDEMFARAEAGSRRAYLQLLTAFDGSPPLGIVFASRIGFSVDGMTGDLAVGVLHADRGVVHPDRFTCSMLAGGSAFFAAAEAGALRTFADDSAAVERYGGRLPSAERLMQESLAALTTRYPDHADPVDLAIPLGLVGEVWRTQPTNVVHIALKADLLWAGHGWFLRT